VCSLPGENYSNYSDNSGSKNGLKGYCHVNLFFIEAKGYNLSNSGNTFSFSSFHELYKCAVEHVFGYKCAVFSGNLSNSGYNYKGYQDYNYNYYNWSNSGNHFKHTFSSIRPTGAEIEAFLYDKCDCKLSNSGNHFKHTSSTIGPTGVEIRPVKDLILSKGHQAKARAKGSTFWFSSFCEPDKCAVLSYSGYNLSGKGKGKGYLLYKFNLNSVFGKGYNFTKSF
jgi:hypothetical protein